MTNDGALTHRVLHPSHAVDKRYRVEVTGQVGDCVQQLEELTALENGEVISPPQVRCLSERKGFAELEVVIHQGKNRQIRRMCAMVGLRVLRLIRVGEGSLSLGGLPAGRWRYLTAEEMDALRGE